MKKYLSKLFYYITDELDLTESQENSIEKAYNAVADWLNQKESSLAKFDITIYPQGSMKLGTVVRPLKKDDYDVDMVCLLRKNTYGLSAREVKQLVGNRLKQHSKYVQMLLPEGKRCWTLQYADTLNFHMDILPAIPNGQEAIKATHKNGSNYTFISTNPHGYAEWFKSRMVEVPAIYNRGSIEKLPEYPKKTALQKVIQLLKRHRDVMFLEDQDNAPASIIITTIAAQLYEHETDLVWLFEKTIQNILKHIEKRADGYWVKNPVNPSENFADKWKMDDKKQTAFFDWVRKVNADYEHLLASSTKSELLDNLYTMFGQKVVDLANNSMGGYDKLFNDIILDQRGVIPFPIQKALDAPHRQKAPWQLPIFNIVKIDATAKSGAGVHKIVSGEPIEKGVKLTFKAIHGIQKPYTVKWQVTNTGYEASSCGQLRGEFYNSDSENIREESTSYTGIHYVQCFVIKNGKCVAKSKEFIVNII